jgi:zinc-binding alcohol dehydrogenase/oxidoreductase
MRAALLTAFGGPEGLQPGDLADPVPEPGEVVVDLVAAALNRRDWWIRRNPARGTPPLVLGSDGAGRVSALGAGVTGVAVGDEVVLYPGRGWGPREDAPGPDFEILGVPRQGTYAERIAVPAELVFPKPAGMSFAEAASLPVAGLTAWRALTTRGRVGSGGTVLVTGAAAGTGVFAVQIAAALGARVLVTTSSDAKLARLRALGAADGADRRDPAWPQAIRALAPGGVDVAIDSAGADSWPGALEALRDGGTLVAFGDTGGEVAPVDVGRIYFGQLNVCGTTLGSPRELAAFLAHAAAPRWRPVIDSEFPLEAADDAHRRLDDPARVGKVVLRIRDA